MKTLSEVCKLVGVTRKTMQEYNRIKLLSPSHITEGGYWEYSDLDVKKLMTIQLLREIGYKRKEIKDLLDNRPEDIYFNNENIINKLKEKKQRIENLIYFLELTQNLFENSPQILSLASLSEISPIYNNKSYKLYLEEIFNSKENQSKDMLLNDDNIIIIEISLIGNCIENPAQSSKVQNLVSKVCDSLIEIFASYEITGKLTKKEISKVFPEILKKLRKKSNIEEILEKLCSKGALDYVIEAFEVYSESL